MRITNGISEIMCLPDTNEKIEIGWIIYSHEVMVEWTSFYVANYGIKGQCFQMMALIYLSYKVQWDNYLLQ